MKSFLLKVKRKGIAIWAYIFPVRVQFVRDHDPIGARDCRDPVHYGRNEPFNGLPFPSLTTEEAVNDLAAALKQRVETRDDVSRHLKSTNS